MSRIIEFEGRRIEVPADATDEEIAQILSAPGEAPPPPAPAPTRGRRFNGRDPSFQDVVVQSMTLGLSNDAEGAAAAAGPLARKVGRAIGLPVEYREGEVGEAYSRGRNEAVRRADRYREENPITGFGGDILGGFANPLARLWAPAGAPSAAAPGSFRFLSPSTWRTPPRATPPATPGAPAFFPAPPAGALVPPAPGIATQIGRGTAVGGGSGAVMGFNQAEGDLDDRAVGGATGAVLGGVIGAAAPALIEGGSGALRWAGDQTLRRASQTGQKTVAQRKVVEALRRDGLSLEDAQRRVAELGPEGALMDVGPNSRALAGSISRAPGKGKTEITNRVVTRQEGTRDANENLVGGQYQRVIDALTDAEPGRLRQTLDALDAQRKTEARPFYERTFSGGSTAPLETQLGDQFATASSATAQARQAVAAAEQKMTLAAAQASRAGDNVYANSSANQARAAAQAELEAAQTALERAQGREAAILERLRQAQTDRATNRPGAVWSPEIQVLLDDPIAQRGLASSIGTQRKEHLARVLRGEESAPFNPTEFAITGFDDKGNPIIGSVPNLRTLDGIKRGLDAEINAARDPVTGRINWTQDLRAVDEVRSALVDTLKKLTGGDEGDYARALSTWAGPSGLMDAAKMGRNFNSFANADDLKNAMKGMTEDQREIFRIGAVQDLIDTAGDSVVRGDIAKKLMGRPNLEEKIKVAFGSREKFAEYIRKLRREGPMFETYTEVTGNSRTQARAAADADAARDPGGTVAAGVNLAGNPTSIPAWLQMWNAVRDRSKGLVMPERARDEAAQYLLGRDTGALNQMMRSQAIREDVRGALSRAGAVSGGVAGTYYAP